MKDSETFHKDFYEFIRENTLVEIKGGRERESFLKIWMVQVGDRFFSRSWNKSARSWFTEFQSTAIGQIKYGNTIINVRGKKLSPVDSIQQKIDAAYLKKYNQSHNKEYSLGITKPEYRNYTMEFFIDE